LCGLVFYFYFYGFLFYLMLWWMHESCG
jgi:hypothetical protein